MKLGGNWVPASSVFSYGFTWDTLNFSSNEQWTTDKEALYQRSSLESVLRTFTGEAGHVDPLCLVHINILDSQRERKCSA